MKDNFRYKENQENQEKKNETSALFIISEEETFSKQFEYKSESYLSC